MKKIKVTYITSYSENHMELLTAVLLAMKKAEDIMVNIKLESSIISNNLPTTTIDSHHTDMIESANLILVNIGKNSANVMYELGMAHALDKPIIIIMDNQTTMPFDLATVRYINYDLNSLSTNFVNHVAKAIVTAINDPDDWKQNTPNHLDAVAKKKTVFVSYSHRDSEYLERIKVHLKPIERNGIIELWSDTLILSGEKWREKIQTALERAIIALLLVSADFMSSEFIINNELQPLLKSAETQGTIIIPVIIKPCRFLREPTISQFQAVNDPLNPLCKLKEFEQEDVYEKIAHRIEIAIGSE